MEISGTVGHRLPAVHVDNAAVGALAAKHLLGKGFSHFGFIGWHRADHCRERQEAFIRTLAQAGAGCEVLMLSGPISTTDRNSSAAMREWRLALPKPVGVLAWFDYTALEAISICRQSGIKVPQQLAILGVDNDEVSCILSDTPISSIDVNALQIGYQAAKLLHQMIEGKKPSPKPLLLQPRGVVERRSTDTLAGASPEVLRALRFIREHANEGIRVGDILRDIPICGQHSHRAQHPAQRLPDSSAGSATGANCIFRNNTIDERGAAGTNSPVSFFLSHAGNQGLNNLNIRNNLFIRTGRIYEEVDVANSIGYEDYNCWAGILTSSNDC